MQVPTIHLNGTSRREIVDALDRAVDALRKAITALSDTAPNGRDYYPQGPQAFEHARAEYADRVRRLSSVEDELMRLWEACGSR